MFNFGAFLIEELAKEGTKAQDIVDLVESNVNVNLSSEFYNELGEGGFLKGEEIFKLNPTKRDEIELLKTLYAKRSAIISSYRDPSAPFETTPMKEVHQREVQILSRNISDQRQGLKLPKNEDISDITEKSVNKAYIDTLKYKNLEGKPKKELGFLIEGGHTNTTLVDN